MIKLYNSKKESQGEWILEASFWDFSSKEIKFMIDFKCYLGNLWYDNKRWQAGAELCQAQDQVVLTAEAELILMLSFMKAISQFQNCFRLY